MQYMLYMNNMWDISGAFTNSHLYVLRQSTELVRADQQGQYSHACGKVAAHVEDAGKEGL